MTLSTEFADQNPALRVNHISILNDEVTHKLAGEDVIAFVRFSNRGPSAIRTMFTNINGSCDYVPVSQLAAYAADLESMGYTNAYDILNTKLDSLRAAGKKSTSEDFEIPYTAVTQETRVQIAGHLADKIIAGVLQPGFRM